MSPTTTTMDHWGFKKLTETNYHVWAPKMKSLMVTKQCWTIDMKEEDVTEEMNQKALAYIMLGVEDSMLPILKMISSAKEAWEILGRLYAGKGNARQMDLRRQLATLLKTRSETMTAYFNRAIGIRDDLKSTDAVISDLEVLWQVLVGLREESEYNTIVKIITNKIEELDLITVMEMMIAEEKTIKKTPTESAFIGGIRRGNGESSEVRCHVCDATGHLARNCPNVKCARCGAMGHSVKACNGKARNYSTAVAL